MSARQPKVCPDWRTTVSFSNTEPDVTVLHESTELRVVLVGLEPGQALPVHPGPAAAFHFLYGAGVIIVNGEQTTVSAGATVVVPSGALRTVRAASRLVFLGSLGDPVSEHGPH